MKLPFKLPFQKKETFKYFLSLVLRDEKVTAVIFEEFLGKVKIAAEQEEYFADSIENAEIEELLEVLDKAISKAEDQISSPIETQKTIFGVKDNWVVESRIKREYLVKLKKVSDAFGLVPLGFLVISEAIAHLLDKDEGAPVSALLIEVGQKTLIISLFRAGKIIEIKEVKIENSIAHTVDFALHHLNYDVLPSRIILFDGEKEDLVREFISHTWSKDLPFLHVPKVSKLPKRFDAKAVMFGAVTQMGFELLQEKEIEENKEFKPDENFGFVQDIDIAKITKKDQEIIQPQSTLKENAPNPFVAKFKVLKFPTIKFPLSSLRDIKIPLNKFSFFSRGKAVFIPPLILIFLILLFLIYIFLTKATVTLRLNPKIIELNQEITFSGDTPLDLSAKSIPYETILVSENGTLSLQTTGKKEIGDKAKGTVTIYSSLSNNQTFTKDTVITSANDLKFTLDDDARVASSSGVSDVQTVKISVAASDIGKEYNLPSGTKFSIASFDTSNVEVKNEASFSGGSKKEISVVSKNDLDKLVKQISNDLEKKAKEEMAQKMSSGKTLLPISFEKNIAKKEFDADLNDEAKTVTIKATVDYHGFLYKNSNLEKFTNMLLGEKISNFITAKNKLSLSLTNVKIKNEKEITAILRVKAGLLPKIDRENITKEITGLPFEEAKISLSKIPQVSDITISVFPSIPFIPQALPRVQKNITIIINTND